MTTPRIIWAVLCSVDVLFPNASKAQCPSVTGSGDPAMILLNLYGMPNVNFFDSETIDQQIGLSAGIQIGAIFSPQFQLVSGVEFSKVSRSLADETAQFGSYHYATRFMEIPLDMRMRLASNKPSELFLILGAGFAFANVRGTGDPDYTVDENQFHQLFGRIGFEHTITVKKTFNVLWGLLGKADVLGIATGDYSRLNGTYFGGVKLGFQFAL